MSIYRDNVSVLRATRAWHVARAEVGKATAARPRNPARIEAARKGLAAATRELRAAVAAAGGPGVVRSSPVHGGGGATSPLPCDDLLRAVREAGRVLQVARGTEARSLGISPDYALRRYREAHAAARACLGPDASRSRMRSGGPLGEVGEVGEVAQDSGTWHRHGGELVLDAPAGELEAELDYKAEFAALYRALAALPRRARLPAIRAKLAALKQMDPTFFSREVPAVAALGDGRVVAVGTAFVGQAGTLLVHDARDGSVRYRDKRFGDVRFRWHGGALVTGDLAMAVVVPPGPGTKRNPVAPSAPARRRTHPEAPR